MNSPSFLGADWPVFQTETDDPYAHMWRELFHFAGENAAKRAFVHAPYHQKFTNFRQAIELANAYILEFEDAEELIDPVPFYYGALWLGLAVAYATLGPQDLNSASKHHGLKTISTPNPFSLTEQCIEPLDSRGSFSLINLAFGGDDYLGTKFSLIELLRTIPELNDDLEQKVGSRTNAFLFRYDPTTLAFSRPVIAGTITRDDDKITEGFLRDNLVVYEYLSTNSLKMTPPSRVSWTPTRSFHEELAQLGLISWSGGAYLQARVRSKILPEFSAYLMLLYYISSLARYHPEVWIPLHDEKSDALFVIRSFMHLAKRAIPRLVLNHLTRRTNQFVAN